MMRTKVIVIGLILSIVCFDVAIAQTAGEKDPVEYVDPMIGTSNARWMMFPGASMPFGMVKLSPDNQRRGWKAGYEYTIDNIAGFSHIHSWTMAGLLTMPTTGPLHVKPGSRDNPDQGYRSRFSHDNEEASPGYYSVRLDDYDIKAELTSTTRAGFQKYTFPKSDSARILLDLQFPSEYSFELSGAQITKVSDNEIQGFSIQQSLRRANYNEYTVHFVMRFSKPFETLNGWTRDGVQRDVDKIFSGWGHTDFGGFVEFNTSEGEVVKVQTGISLVSVEQARKNLEKEMVEPFGWDFVAVQENARQTWNDLLSTIEVEGGTEENKTKFYTNLYRSYVGRTIWSDVDGKYVDMCEETVQLEDPSSPVYGGDAFWNTFWNLNQLWTLATPDVANNWVKSLLEMYDRGGWLPKGPTGIEYSSIMVASHEIPLMVSAYQKGIRDYDIGKAYEAMKHNQMEPGKPHECGGHVGNRHLKSYMELGYVADEVGPVSNTMEYAYDDWTVAQMAKALGKEGDYQYFLNRAENYKNIFDPSVGYVRMKKANGDWVGDFDPYCCSTFRGSGYVEGNAWQYTFFAPHDVPGLVDLVGKEEFNTRLEEGFKKSQKYRFNAEQIDYDNNLHAMGLLPVNHGNQPNMQSAYLFNYSGQPWQTQKWARAIMDEYYGLGPEDGWPGDEDQGQMGAWFVMSSMGLFQMEGGASTEPFYELGSPLFEKVTIHLDNKYYDGDTFVIEAKEVSDKNKYIQSAELNGKSLDKPWFYHKDLVNGSKLTLQMGPEPNKSWGSDSDDAPPSMTTSDEIESEVKSEAGTAPDNLEDFEQGHYELFAPTYLGGSDSWVRPNAEVTDQNPISGKYSLCWDANDQEQEWVFASNAFYLKKPFTLSAKIRVDSPGQESFGLGIAALQNKDEVTALRLDEKGAGLDQKSWGDGDGGHNNFDFEPGSVYTLQLTMNESEEVEAKILDGKGQQVHASLQGKSEIDPSAIGLYLSTPSGGKSTLYVDDVSVKTPPYSMQADTWTRSPRPLALSRLPDVSQDQGNWVGGMTVRKIDDEYLMWYRIRNNDKRGGGYGLARSQDGLQWQKHDGNPLFKADDKYDSNEKISVLKVNDMYQAWYAVDTGDSWATAYATSDDGINWQKHGIVIDGYAKDTDVVYVDGTYYLYAIAPTKEDISVFTSSDGKEWERRKTFAMGAHRHPAAYYVDQDQSFRLYAFGGGKGVSVATSKDGINFSDFKKEWDSSPIGLDDWDQWGVDYGAFPTDEWGHLREDENTLMYYQARHAYGNNHGTWKYHGDGIVLTAGKFSNLFVGVPIVVSPNQPYDYKAFPYPAKKASGLSVTASAPVTVTVDEWDRSSEFAGRGRVQTKEKGQVRFDVTGLKSNEEYKLQIGKQVVAQKTNKDGGVTFIVDVEADSNSIFTLMIASF